MRLLLGTALLLRCLGGQWIIQQSGTTVSLRGVDAVGEDVAWASGTDGTVLRTTDGGRSWERCTTPAGANKLDFRAVQGVGKNTALVMSSGTGDASRVFKTSDGCRSWRLVFTNPDAPDGFFDVLRMEPGAGRDLGRVAEIVGDPVNGAFPLFRTDDYGESWTKYGKSVGALTAKPGEALFAASNSALIELGRSTLFVTGGSASRSLTIEEQVENSSSILVGNVGGDLPMPVGASAGAFSVAARRGHKPVGKQEVLVALGGDYRRPDARQGTCARSDDGGLHWQTCNELPGGYRSSVEFDRSANMWIAVGPNGTDVSTDDGRHWRPLKAGAADAADADKNWNALSLPFVVGTNGRIGKLR